jgi:hypothetical protein
MSDSSKPASDAPLSVQLGRSSYLPGEKLQGIVTVSPLSKVTTVTVQCLGFLGTDKAGKLVDKRLPKSQGLSHRDDRPGLSLSRLVCPAGPHTVPVFQTDKGVLGLSLDERDPSPLTLVYGDAYAFAVRLPRTLFPTFKGTFVKFSKQSSSRCGASVLFHSCVF